MSIERRLTMLPALRNPHSLSRTNGENRLAPLFDSFFGEFWPLPMGQPTRASSAISAWQDDNAVYVEMDAPGVAEDDLEVYLEGGMLVVRGERKAERHEGGCDARSYGRFEHQISLPATVDAETIEARLNRGVLRITCAKSEASKPRRIAVKNNE
jgi:HSP20 family protein